MAILTRNNIVTNGLVFCLDASNTLSYTSGSASWRNVAGTGSWTITNGTAITATFETNPPAIFVTQSTSTAESSIFGFSNFPFSENLSIELWYKTRTTGSGVNNQGQSPGIIQIGDYNGNASFTLWDWSANTPGQHTIRTFINNGNTWSHSLTSNTIYSDSQWVDKYHHIVMNFSGSLGKWNKYNLYIDGVLQSTVNFTIPFPSASISGGNTTYIPGAAGGAARNSYAVVRIYNRELTVSDITQNYNATKTRFGLT